MSARWHLQIDRVVVTGATCEAPGTGELRTLVERAVVDAVTEASWPAGRAAHGAIWVNAPGLGDGPAIAAAVGRGVSQALKGRSHG